MSFMSSNITYKCYNNGMVYRISLKLRQLFYWSFSIDLVEHGNSSYEPTQAQNSYKKNKQSMYEDPGNLSCTPTQRHNSPNRGKG